MTTVLAHDAEDEELPAWSLPADVAESRPSVTWKLLELLAERLRTAEHR
jgi:hypothetical protein